MKICWNCLNDVGNNHFQFLNVIHFRPGKWRHLCGDNLHSNSTLFIDLRTLIVISRQFSNYSNLTICVFHSSWKRWKIKHNFGKLRKTCMVAWPRGLSLSYTEFHLLVALVFDYVHVKNRYKLELLLITNITKGYQIEYNNNNNYYYYYQHFFKC